MKLGIYKDDREDFENLAYRALMITMIATKKKSIRSLPGYFKGVLDKLVDETYFQDMFMLSNQPMEFYCPRELIRFFPTDMLSLFTLLVQRV